MANDSDRIINPQDATHVPNPPQDEIRSGWDWIRDAITN